MSGDALLTSESVESHWLGIDVAKASFEVGLVRPGQHYPQTALRDLPTTSLPRTPEGAGKLIAWLDAQVKPEERESVRVVMEATGRYSTQLATWLAGSCPSLAPAIINPAQAKAFISSLGLRNKTDRFDARALAFYGAERRPAPQVTSAPAWVELRALSRQRTTLKEEHAAAQNRAEEGSDSLFVRRFLNREVTRIAGAVDRIEKQMRKVISKNAELTRDMALLQTIEGVGFVTAATVLAELGDLRRFQRARQLTAYAGLNPSIRESGSSVEAKPHLCKRGNPRVRKALYMAALTHVRKPSRLTNTYNRLVDAQKPTLQALCAVMRKLLTVMRAILISGEQYNANYQRKKTTGACG